ncbi:MAG: tetratricopeptide repeat protein [Verrucomicrobiota bacterium]
MKKLRFSILFLTAGLAGLTGCKDPAKPEKPTPVPEVARAPYQPAETCQTCHPQQYNDWLSSHHANANRLVDPELDAGPFAEETSVKHGSTTSTFRRVNGEFQIHTVGLDGNYHTMKPESVIGIDPLIQYLMPFPNGRLQAFSLAWDVHEKEWFDIFSDEDRRPHEWGFWAGRGMNWNAQCASCHMTGYVKGYDTKTDSYNTRWDAQSIACAQCHTGLDEHVKQVKNGTYKKPETPPDPEQRMQICGGCHSRREELTTGYVVDEPYFDHFRLSLPDAPGLYYADGQVLEEDYVYGSFLMSRMGHKGVTCFDCHNPHSGGLIAPVENNQLCMSCHQAPGNRGAVPIDPVAHSFHQAGSTGNQCVNCHMPSTPFMVRDPRRDHGFTIPDPLLTKELGIPNACNRCHEDQSVDWAVEWTEKWYGERMNRRSRDRTRLVARAYERDETVLPELMAMAMAEDNPAWRAALILLCANWSERSDVQRLLKAALQSDDPLIRSAGVRSLSPHTAHHHALLRFLNDPSRLVRLDAAWGLHGRFDKSMKVYEEMRRYLDHTSDQPVGALKQAQLATEENRMADAEFWIDRATKWDPMSAWFPHFQGIILNRSGKNPQAIESFLKAAELEPENGDHLFSASLIYGEMGQIDKVIETLQRTVKGAPGHARAWYNLGLAQASQEKLNEAVEAILKAETLEPASAEFPYARATIHLRQRDPQRARAAAEKALTADPNYRPALQLLQSQGGLR